MTQPTSAHEPFDIRAWVDHNRSGRAACPACVQAGKTNQRNLSIDLTTGAYHCWRGCTTAQIREALGAPKGSTARASQVRPQQVKAAVPLAQTRTFPEERVRQSQNRLLHSSGQPQAKALAWLQARGFTSEMIAHYRLGLEPYWLTPEGNKAASKECYWAIALHLPAAASGQFYRKLRLAPWLTGEERPAGLPKWSQYGVPATIFYAYRPDQATETWFCEGEWDAMRLGWLAQQLQTRVTVCCATAGCGTVPKQADLAQLPGPVTLFFDRNDAPTKHGMIPGEAGAQKLALALGERSRIALVPMPDGCTVKGWDVSNALDAGFGWADFAAAAQAAVPPVPDLTAQPKTLVLRERLLKLSSGDETPFAQELALLSLARETGYPYRDLNSLAKSLEQELDWQFDRAAADHKLKTLLETRRTHLDLTRYLEPWFADILQATAKAMPTAPEFLFTTLLPAAASRIGTGAQVVIKPSAKYTQPMVFWSAIVAHSGSMKTPAQRVILDPLIALEKDAYESYQTELADYRAVLESQKSKKRESSEAETPQPPIRKRYLTKDSTLETLQRLHSENPRGLLYYRDELAGAVKVRNQYRGGYGADEEAELDQWVGSAVIVDRSEKSLCLPRSAISRTGAIQWEVLADLMGDHQDVNGAWSRWLFCAAESPPRYLRLVQEDQDTGITEALTDLYTALEQVPQQDYLLSVEAKQLFETWQHQVVDAQRAEETLGLQLVYPKIEAYTARLALWLHLVNAVLRREPPAPALSGDTMTKAIELAAYYLWQHRLIHTQNAPESGLAAIGLKIQKFAERVGEVTASRLKAGIRDLRKVATAQIRQLMQTLAGSGYGSVQGEGAEMTYLPAPGDQQLQLDLSAPNLEAIDTVDPQLTTLSIDEIASEPEFQAAVDESDTVEEPAAADSRLSSDNLSSEPPQSLQRDMAVEVWLQKEWVPAIYIRPLACLIFSHRTRKLDEGHQVTLAPDVQQRQSAAPRLSAYRVARSDLRFRPQNELQDSNLSIEADFDP